jgi:DNA-binding NtrC family response regulator
MSVCLVRPNTGNSRGCKAFRRAIAGGTSSAKPTTVSEACAKTASILVVDDDVELLKALTKVLRLAGYGVIDKPDAISALNYLQDSGKRFDLVITDVSMPKMKGTTLLHALKAVFPDLPVVVITAFGDWGQYADVLRGGAFEYMSKPLEQEELLACVRRALTHSDGE